MCGSRIIATAMLLMQSAASLQPQRIHLVVNPFGGGGAGLATMEAVLPIFEKAGIEVTTLQTEYAGHAGEYAQTVPLHDAFIGIGGDGTAHEIANGMLRRDEADRVPIGIIPAGSGNTWAFDLGLAGAEDAASIIVNGQTAAVDVMAISAVDQPEASFQAASNPWHFISSGCAAEPAQRVRLREHRRRLTRWKRMAVVGRRYASTRSTSAASACRRRCSRRRTRCAGSAAQPLEMKCRLPC